MNYTTKAVLSVDIVTFSKKPLEEQVRSTQALIQLLNLSIPKEENSEKRRIWSPAGDGGCITFWENTFAAITTAVTLGSIINQYNQYVEGGVDLKDLDDRLKDITLPKCKEE